MISRIRKTLTQKQRRKRGNRVVISLSLLPSLVEEIDKERGGWCKLSRSRWIELAVIDYLIKRTT